MYKYKLLKNDVLLLLYNEIISSGNCCQHYYNIDEEVISILKGLTYEEVVHLCEHPCPLVNFQVNSVTLKAQLNRLNEERKRKEIIGRAVEMKASRKLLAEYYGIGQEELQQMRVKLEVDIKRGRVQKIDENISRCIWDVFSMLPQKKQDISKTECFEEMVKLAEKYGVSVMAVYDTLTEGMLAGKRIAEGQSQVNT
ncbi:DUF2857 family protein [Serratia marcescens]|nr:DUF2857 family protein [Serratia marcescens]